MRRLSISLSSNLFSPTPILYLILNCTVRKTTFFSCPLLLKTLVFWYTKARHSGFFSRLCLLSMYSFDGIKCRLKMVKDRLHGIVIAKQQTWTNNGHQTNKSLEWNLWIFPRCFANNFVSLRYVCMIV